MEQSMTYQGQLVFGLDIGTRSLVGTVGYKEEEEFHVVAQCVKEHETRAMLDGQIHDIQKVGNSIVEVKETLEKQTGRRLQDVCIAAAGRVLRTISTEVLMEFDEDTVVTDELVYNLESLGVEKAHEELLKIDDIVYKFYCVGYTVVKYMLNDYQISNLKNHKARKIQAEMIVTFLPEDVVDGLYKAVELAGLNVAALTLEPIAAMNVAIPEMYRMLNIALVDVGAGTSDICITKDGSIVAYGMIPYAGDELTECIARQYLLDFKTADQLKIDASAGQNPVTYKDIMGLTHETTAEEVLKVCENIVDEITSNVAEKIKELNGGKSVSAVFIVGGGGKIPGFTDMLADRLEILNERVALRGEEVMNHIHFLQQGIKKDPLLVTPIGICMNFYDQTNNFIYVNFNGERIKLYDNSKLTIVDAAMQAGFPNEKLFPRRGQELEFTVNDRQKIIRGEFGEPANVSLNGEAANINTPIKANDLIRIQESTAGKAAEYQIDQLVEFNSTIEFTVNGTRIQCPKFATVNGTLVTGSYSIRNGDVIQMCKYYTVQQILDFMDVVLEEGETILVNHVSADKNTMVYDNFSIDWILKDGAWTVEPEIAQETVKEAEFVTESEDNLTSTTVENEESSVEEVQTEQSLEQVDQPPVKSESTEPMTIVVTVNQKPIRLEGKANYLFVDAYDKYGFQVSEMLGTELVLSVNGEKAEFISPIYDGDVIEIYWRQDS